MKDFFKFGNVDKENLNNFDENTKHVQHLSVPKIVEDYAALPMESERSRSRNKRMISNNSNAIYSEQSLCNLASVNT